MATLYFTFEGSFPLTREDADALREHFDKEDLNDISADEAADFLGLGGDLAYRYIDSEQWDW